jgi:small-conductance mechanosensitive channel
LDNINNYLASLGEQFAALMNPVAGTQLAVVVVAALVAWYLQHRGTAHLRHLRGKEASRIRRFFLSGAIRLILPLVMLALLLLARGVYVQMQLIPGVLDIAITLVLALAAIRILVFLMLQAFGPAHALKGWEKVIRTIIWVIVALQLLGMLPAVLGFLDSIAYEVGEVRVSLLEAIKLVLALGILLLLSLWLSRVIEKRIMGSAHLESGMRAALAKTAKFLLVTIALLVALNTVGIDLTSLTVFGGALGVGLGFGLQRIASNLVSGFLLLYDRSIKPGDVITIGDSFGWVVGLHARYVVVRDRNGVETLIPNENLITSEVINWSYSDRNIRIKIPVQISYGDDPEKAMELMLQAARVNQRIHKEELQPVCRLMGFGDNGINLEVRVWIADPEEGVNNVRSDINLAIWRAFKEHGITIPFPQRDLYLKSMPEHG